MLSGLTNTFEQVCGCFGFYFEPNLSFIGMHCRSISHTKISPLEYITNYSYSITAPASEVAKMHSYNNNKQDEFHLKATRSFNTSDICGATLCRIWAQTGFKR